MQMSVFHWPTPNQIVSGFFIPQAKFLLQKNPNRNVQAMERRDGTFGAEGTKKEKGQKCLSVRRRVSRKMKNGKRGGGEQG